jgi:hypothetical protein
VQVLTGVQAIAQAVLLRDERPPVPSSLPQELVQLMINCWHKAPASRPTFTHVRQRLVDLMPSVAAGRLYM